MDFKLGIDRAAFVCLICQDPITRFATSFLLKLATKIVLPKCFLGFFVAPFLWTFKLSIELCCKLKFMFV